LVRILRIICLITNIIQRANIIPDFANVWVDIDRTRIRIKGIQVLAQLVEEHAQGTPDIRVGWISIHSVLVGIISVFVILDRHVTTTKEVPAFAIMGIYR
jgi:hypothetical protein